MKYILINRSAKISGIARYNLKHGKPFDEVGVRVTHQNMTLNEMNGSIIQAHFENGVKKCCHFKVGNWKSMMEHFDSLMEWMSGGITHNTAIKTDISVTAADNTTNMPLTSSVDKL